MNALAGTLIMLWLTGWTLAMMRAALKARIPATPASCKSPRKGLPN
jgi:hypothetical protein